MNGTTKARRDAEAIFRAAVARVDPAPMIERAVTIEAASLAAAGAGPSAGETANLAMGGTVAGGSPTACGGPSAGEAANLAIGGTVAGGSPTACGGPSAGEAANLAIGGTVTGGGTLAGGSPTACGGPSAAEAADPTMGGTVTGGGIVAGGGTVTGGGPAACGEELVVRTGFEEARYALSDFDRIFATGMGKASARMAAGLERALGDRLAGGLVAVKEGHVEALSRIRLVETGHPVPDERSQAAALAILDLGHTLGTKLTERDLVIVLVSGGGSAILCAPAEGLTLPEKAATTRLLLASGATINEVNCVRKHLSAVKGGRLAAALAPATVLALVLSDVIGDDLDAIASGPTVPDPTSFADALSIVRRYGIEDKLPEPVAQRLRSGASSGAGSLAGIVASGGAVVSGAAGALEDTPKPGDSLFARTRTLLVGTNRLALTAAEAEAKKRGYRSLVLSSRITGEAREVALVFLGMGKDIQASGFPLERPACLIAGGETTVTIRGKGLGGRNQEMALAFLAALGRSPKDGEDLCFLSAGTDGNDGPTEAAGAWADLELYRVAIEAGLDPDLSLAHNDSNSFFTEAGGIVWTGPTNTNVCDVQILLVP